MKIEVTSVCSRDGGAAVCVSVRLSDGENSERRELILLASQYSELRVAKGEIDADDFDRLQSAAELCSAVRRGMALLGYGACSKRALTLKLRTKGIAPDMARSAADLLERIGYIDETADAQRVAERCVKKYWGKSRISAELFSKGYSDQAVRAALDSLDEVDFAELCAEYIEDKYRVPPSEPEQRRKLFSALTRRGFSSSDIKDAIRKLES